MFELRTGRMHACHRLQHVRGFESVCFDDSQRAQEAHLPSGCWKVSLQTPGFRRVVALLVRLLRLFCVPWKFSPVPSLGVGGDAHHGDLRWPKDPA